MLFSGVPFLFYFLPATLLLYSIAPRKLKNAVLLVASLFFYWWGERKLVLLFALSITFGWLTGLLIERFRGRVWSRVFLLLSVAQNLGFLIWFKYTDFLISGFNALLGTSVPLLHIALPIGISFYTFQILSYTVDVYRGDVPARRNLIDFGTYVALFPQLIAGPIVRYSDIADSLTERRHTVADTADGIRRFLVGLGKKVLLANIFGELCTKFRAAEEQTVVFYWLYAIAYMLQIYFDFSGYSDMAIGLGKIFGFHFAENFNYPYISKSVTEFWRRWHMSLGGWFRDYVYIPLGGNRRGFARQIFNILVVWMLTGLWHGAAWNFVLWGLFYAVLLTLEKLFFKKFLDRHPAFGHVYLLFAVLLGFVLFNAADSAQLVGDLRGLFGFGGIPVFGAETAYYLRSYAVPLLVGVIGATPLPKMAVNKLRETKVGSYARLVAEPLFYVGVLLIATGYLVDGSFNPFLYFRF